MSKADCAFISMRFMNSRSKIWNFPMDCLSKVNCALKMLLISCSGGSKYRYSPSASPGSAAAFTFTFEVCLATAPPFLSLSFLAFSRYFLLMTSTMRFISSIGKSVIA